MKRQYEDTEFDYSLKKLDSDFLWKTKQKQELKNRILMGIENLEINGSNKNLIKFKNNNKRSLTGRLVYSGIALVLLFSLFIGSAFVSPVMAEVVSKIPYLNKILNSKPITIIIIEKLKNEGYKIAGISGGKEIKIEVEGSKQYFQDVQKGIENIALQALKANKYDGYAVKVVQSKPNREEKLSSGTKNLYGEATKVNKTLQDEFVKRNYHDIDIQIEFLDSGELKIIIGLPNTEKNPDEIKELARNIIAKTTNKDYKLEFKTFNLKIREQEERWGGIFNTIIEGLYSKKEYHVKGYSYSANPQPMTLYIKTTISSSNPESKQLGIKIENTIKEFLESEDAKKIIKDDKYKIIVYSKEKQKIN
ncbi:DUF4030 domain-containing protein [Niallia sp. 03133]|uniref:DUF4030 domain-containing protein n=1 Tax=Niallia sp. 03133 TaxID=3458060 RepID=UPI004044840F